MTRTIRSRIGSARRGFVSLAHACLALPLITTGVIAAGDIPAIPEGTPYATARGVLIARGFRPVASGEHDASRCSAGRQDVCDAYPETISCAGTGAAACRFIFSGPHAASVTLVADGPNVGRLKVTAVRRSAQRDVEWQRGAGPRR
jgi:hypothetical protein